MLPYSRNALQSYLPIKEGVAIVRRNKGFTLIELLVVITIIAVLAAILFPVFLMARAKARQMSCLANLKQFGTTFNMYLGDWDNRYPYTSFPTGSGMTLGNDCVGMSTTVGTPFYNMWQETWLQKLEPYVKYQLVRGSGAALGGGKPQGIMRCKDVDRTWKVTPYTTGEPDHASYGYNFLYLGLPFQAFQDTPPLPDDRVFNQYAIANNGGWVKGAAKQSSLGSPAETLLLIENATIWAFPPCMANGTSFWMTNGNKYIRPRHGNKSDVLYCDGHVTSLETKTLVGYNVQYGNQGTTERGASKNNDMWDTQ